jgi:hypothetical protein
MGMEKARAWHVFRLANGGSCCWGCIHLYGWKSFKARMHGRSQAGDVELLTLEFVRLYNIRNIITYVLV